MRSSAFSGWMLALLLLLAGCADSTTPDAERDANGTDDASVARAATPLPVEEAVIYEVFVRQFTPEGTFQAMIPRLSELKELGVNVLWLMPIHPIGEEQRKGPLGSPYSIQDYFAVNPLLGTDDDFRALVDSVHAYDMHVIIDFVANHTAFDNAWAEEHPEWYTRDEQGTIVHPEGTDWTDVADLNYDNPEVHAEMQRALEYWVREFDIDGYRCDVAEMVPIEFWETSITALRDIKPVLMLAEGADPALHEAGFNLTYPWETYRALIAAYEGAPVSDFVQTVEEDLRTLPEGANRIRFTTNHDETAWDAPPVILFKGLDGARAASVAMMALPGVPLLYNGQEVGSDVATPLFEKEPIMWDQNPEMRTFYQAFLEAYAAHAPLQDGDVRFLAPDAEDVLLYERTDGDERVLVAANVRDRATTIALPTALQNTPMRDLLSGETITLGAELALEPYAYHLLVPAE